MEQPLRLNDTLAEAMPMRLLQVIQLVECLPDQRSGVQDSESERVRDASTNAAQYV